MSEVTKKMPLEQKAAAVVVALGVDKASRIYQNMPSEQVEQLTYEIARLGNLSMEDTEEILEEFYQLCMTRKAITVGGMEYARTVLEKAFGDTDSTSAA